MKVRVLGTGIATVLILALILIAGWACQTSYGETGASQPAAQVESYNGWSADRNYYYVDGQIVTNKFMTVAGNLYYFDATGKKQTSGYREDPASKKFYTFASSGVASPVTGFYGQYYYYAGVKASGFRIISGSLYYFNTTTKIKQTSGYRFYKSKLYRFASTGKGSAYSGVYKRYYYTKGIKQTRYKKTVKRMNNGKVYYFYKNGKVSGKTGWRTVKGKRYYFKKGVGHQGWKYVGKYKYYFSKKGVRCNDLIKRFGKKWKKKNLLIKVNRKRNCVTIYAKDGKRGYTIPVKAFACSVGKKHTPTVRGTYKVNRSRTYRWGKLGGPTMGGYCYGQYCSRITGGYLFHSVTYSQRNKRTMSSTAYNNLGRAASHGCVRLQTINAKLIYDIARYRTTKVVIYDSKSAGPLGKPKIKKVRAGRGTDPTDPTL